MVINENSFRVRYVETDQMGIVYHSNYYVWFDMGRTEFMRSLGYDYSRLEDEGLILPILETHCIHKKSAKYDDLITVKTSLKELKGVRISFNYDVYNENGELIATGSTVQAFVNRAMHPINIKKIFPAVYEKLVACM